MDTKLGSRRICCELGPRLMENFPFPLYMTLTDSSGLQGPQNLQSNLLLKAGQLDLVSQEQTSEALQAKHPAILIVKI